MAETHIAAKHLINRGTYEELLSNLYVREIGWCTDDNILYAQGNEGLYPLSKIAVVGPNAQYGDVHRYLARGALPVMETEVNGVQLYLYPQCHSNPIRFGGIHQNNYYCAEWEGSTGIWKFFATGLATSSDILSLQSQMTGLRTNTEYNIALLRNDVNATEAKVNSVEEVVPGEASASNQLADKSYVANQINQVAARYLSGDVDGNPFATYEAFEAAQENDGFFYAGVAATPTKNDYALVSADEEHDGSVTRYWYTGSSWSFQYVVNDTPFTDAEWAAIRSGITSEKLASIEGKIAGALDSVAHDDTLSGDGTDDSPLSAKEMVGASSGASSVTIGGRTYRTVTIGNQTWLAENLALAPTGIEIGPAGTPSQPAAWYYNNTEAYGDVYGLFYNWWAVKYLNDNANTLFPGWHVATSDEWATLFSEVGGEANAGTALKATTVWNEGAGTDTYGFGVIPCGAYWGWGESGGGDFDGIGYNTTFWTALGDTATSTAVSVRFSSDTGAARLDGYSSVFGFSLRLIKDTPAIGKDGEKGLVPKPTESDASKVLSGAGTWVPLPTTDNFLSPTSTNAVQNKVIYDAIGNVEALLAAL